MSALLKKYQNFDSQPSILSVAVILFLILQALGLTAPRAGCFFRECREIGLLYRSLQEIALSYCFNDTLWTKMYPHSHFESWLLPSCLCEGLWARNRTSLRGSAWCRYSCTVTSRGLSSRSFLVLSLPPTAGEAENSPVIWTDVQSSSLSVEDPSVSHHSPSPRALLENCCVA